MLIPLIEKKSFKVFRMRKKSRLKFALNGKLWPENFSRFAFPPGLRIMAIHFNPKEAIVLTQHDDHNTPLSDWLKENEMSVNKLASMIEVSPNSLYRLVQGENDQVSKTVLHNVKQLTGISTDRLLYGYANEKVMPIDTGDERINHILQIMEKETHNGSSKELAKYVSEDFLCSGAIYQAPNQKKRSLTFAEMCASNRTNRLRVETKLMSAWWWTPSGEPSSASRHLVAMYLNSVNTEEGAVAMQTLVMLSFEKSINDMQPEETPKIHRWWWHHLESPEIFKAETASTPV